MPTANYIRDIHAIMYRLRCSWAVAEILYHKGYRG